MSVQSFVELYRYALQPIAPFTWFGLGVSTLDVVAAFRLCYVLKQIRENLYAEHLQRRTLDNKIAPPEERSFVRDVATTLTVVYGGEAIAGPLLGVPPSFMVSGVSPALYAAVQAVVDRVPLPAMSLNTEFPLSFLDGFTRAMLLCQLIPPAVVANASPVIASSPWTLLLTSLLITNGGFFITNLVSFLHPTPLALATPAELQPYGWTTTDLWSAPLVTGLYALLTHAQPFWGELHSVLSGILGGGVEKVEAMDNESARAICALVLAGMFATRTAKNFGYAWKSNVSEKMKTQ
ncbi:hypothetical protein BJ138DRAFT_1057715 [Hygrophoropsis aurantiaca]|uniref:Uncharacterized protein n=1 Tax=Hygrophoropsis aurantiaca TaxID=72124 RepID=A0ACB8ALC2_9AGAM|nr:hypothetical protein BJ138DRAFT_1057715 [Hygrophoropsis aurantiaca]